MPPDHECSHRSKDDDHALGLLLCLLVIAYIYYIHTSHQASTPAQEPTQEPNPGLGPIEATPVKAPATPIPDTIPSLNCTSRTPHDTDFPAGLRAKVHFDILDIRRAEKSIEKLDHESKKREKRMEKRLADFDREYVKMEAAMKTWREEYLRVLWEVKQKRERSLLTGWFKFGSTRSPRAIEIAAKEVEDSVLELEDERLAEKEVRYDDMKKG